MGPSDDDQGAWAGDDIPVPEPPAAPSWTTPSSADPPTAGAPSGESDPTAEPTFDPLAESPGSDPDRSGSWTIRSKLFAGGVAALVGIVAVVVVLTGGDTPATPAAAPTTSEGTPATTDEVVATTAVDSTAVDSTDVAESDPPAVISQIELPPSVAAIRRPTEVLMLTDAGMARTLSLPSGTVRSVSVLAETSLGFGGAMAVAPDAAAFAAAEGLVIVPREGPTIVVEMSDAESTGWGNLRWTPGVDGATTFIQQMFDSSGEPTTYRVSLDGSVTPIDAIAANGAPIGGVVVPDGWTYFADAGGVYGVEPGGMARRVDDGMLVAASVSTLFVRECSEQFVCSHVLIDRTTGERRVVPDDFLADVTGARQFGMSLAPDGSALSVLQSVENSMEQVIVDLATGEQITASSGGFGGTWYTWAADSSGTFDSGAGERGLRFLDRASGESVQFGEELGRIVAVATRHPEAELGPEQAISTSTIEFDDADGPPSTGLRVVALGRNNDVHEIDIDARTVDLWQLTVTDSVRKPSLFAFDGRLTVVAAEVGGDATAPRAYSEIPGRRDRLPNELFGRGASTAGPSPATVWTSVDPPQGVDQHLVDLALAAPVDPEQRVRVPLGELLGGDGRGGLVIEQGGDVYIATAESIERLTTGELLAIGADTAYVRECDAPGTCAVLRVDRDAGTRTPIDPASSLVAAIAIDGDDRLVGVVGTAVAPGGDTVVVQLPTLSDDPTAPVKPVWSVVDAVTGSAQPIVGMTGDSPIVWSLDGQAGVMLDGSDLVVYSRGERLRTVIGTGSLRAIAAAPIGVS